MVQMLMPMWDDLGGRIIGPFAFRLILQPIVAAILAIEFRGVGMPRALNKAETDFTKTSECNETYSV